MTDDLMRRIRAAAVALVEAEAAAATMTIEERVANDQTLRNLKSALHSLTPACTVVELLDRIERLQANEAAYKAKLREARDLFRTYQIHHLAKDPPQHEKADTNRVMANALEQLMGLRSTDPGTPEVLAVKSMDGTP
jgi:hypothetical protein